MIAIRLHYCEAGSAEGYRDVMERTVVTFHVENVRTQIPIACPPSLSLFGREHMDCSDE